MKNQFLIKRVILLVILASLGGCAKWFNPMGDNKYDCNRKEDPDSPYCHSFRAVEAATSNDIPDSRYDEEMSIAEADERSGIAPRKSKKRSKAKKSAPNSKNKEAPEASPLYVAGNQAGSALPTGTPVRVGPVLQRTWIKSFDDNNDLLTSDLYVYKEVVPTHWAGRTPGNSYNKTAPGAYPHKPLPVSPTPALSPNQTTNSVPDQPSVNLDFSQPGAGDTSHIDANDASMPE